MKAHLDISHEGTISDEGRVRMTFDENSIAHLMSILTDLYSDPQLAVIREYSTNALDAHRAAGINDPIEILLPSPLNPVFVVKDHGIGMSVEDICTHLTKYGWSSKRDTDNEVGMLGLGFKSALTYTSQFTLIAVQNGVKAIVLVTREDDGTGAIQVMDTSSTEEPNGVEVHIPIKNAVLFNAKAQKFFRFWERGTVLVDGKEPDYIMDGPKSLVLDPDVVLLPSGTFGMNHIIMGNVPYPCTKALGPHSNNEVVVRVPIGSVNFTPSREALHYTQRTLDVVESIYEFVKVTTLRVAQAEMDACKNHAEALEVANKWSLNHHFRSLLSYRGEKVPMEFYVVKEFSAIDNAGHPYTAQRYGYSWNTNSHTDAIATRVGHISVRDVAKSRFLVGYNRVGIDAITKKRLQKWVASMDAAERPRQVIAVPFRFGGLWVDDKLFITYEDLKKNFKVENPYGKPVSTKPQYKVLNSHGTLSWKEDLSGYTQLCYITTQDREKWSPYLGNIGSWASSRQVGLICLGANQVKKFKATFPQAEEFSVYFEKLFTAFQKALTPEQIMALDYRERIERLGIFLLKSDQLIDPDLRAVVSRLKIVDAGKLQNEWNWYCGLYRQLTYRPAPVLTKDKSFIDFLHKAEEAAKRYPLLGEVVRYGGRHCHDSLVEYINAVYLQRAEVEDGVL